MNDIRDLKEGLKNSPNILTEFVRTIPVERLDRRRGEGFWTIAEHVSHLALVQPMMLERLKRFIEEDFPEFVPYIPGQDQDEPDTPERMEMVDALAEFSLYRGKQLALLADAAGSSWQKKGAHPEYDLYSLHILVRHILMHDHWHMYRMEELWLTRDDYLTGLE
jgi:uncharacterized damage-inducible protein DinB